MSIHRFPLSTTPPQDVSPGGSRTAATAANFPILRGMSLYRLEIGEGGFREPHWHPETAELGYVVCGRGRMTIRAPGGAKSVDTFDLERGDIYFIPKAYPHHIENIGSGPDAEKLHFLVFFDQAMGQDIGYTGGIPAFPRRIVAPTLGTTVAALPRYPDAPSDLLIVRALTTREKDRLW